MTTFEIMSLLIQLSAVLLAAFTIVVTLIIKWFDGYFYPRPTALSAVGNCGLDIRLFSLF